MSSTDAALDARAEIAASIARDSFADFVQQAWHVLEPNGSAFIMNPGTGALIDHLQAVADGKIRRLLIACPPGFGKSTIATVAWPLWMWARNPSWRVICASYAYALASQLANRAKRVLEDEWYRDTFGVVLRAERADALETTAGGRRFFCGVGGALTGFRANAFVVDDSLNAVDALSDVATARVNQWHDTALSNRLDRGHEAPQIVIQQSLNDSDLIAHLRRRGGYDELVLAAKYEPEFKCKTSIWEDGRTERGQLLAPEIQSQAFLDEQEIVLGPYAFAAQYQQRPAPLEGGMIKREWFKRFTLGELMASGKLDLDCVTISVDPTGNAVAAGDNVGLLVVGNKGPRRYVLEDATRRMTFLETCAAIRVLLSTYPQCRKVLIEKSVVGPAIVEQLRKEVNTGALRTVVIEELTTHMLGKKEQRAMAMVPALAAGLVYLLDGASWITAFVAEMGMFPNGQHDDRVDALAQLLAHFAGNSDVERARKMLGMGQMFAGMR